MEFRLSNIKIKNVYFPPRCPNCFRTGSFNLPKKHNGSCFWCTDGQQYPTINLNLADLPPELGHRSLDKPYPFDKSGFILAIELAIVSLLYIEIWGPHPIAFFMLLLAPAFIGVWGAIYMTTGEKPILTQYTADDFKIMLSQDQLELIPNVNKCILHIKFSDKSESYLMMYEN
jgi:hypothetical protein